ncbi:hypothetical protein L6164_023226 [Bauhinia variegata]|uniref:Uncharacterized protein n=1 Tax=Bauhinia variegata TaxID=167791 RepID=A0ACB9MHN5_BAUVA|nr:hypothetical protein L6164_023226 [Bauhinia variegata]
MESEEHQSVAVIHYASRELSANGVKYALDQLDLKPGDKLTLVAVLHHIITPMGYKISWDESSFIATSKKSLEGELTKMREEYDNSSLNQKISEYCQTKQVAFHIEVQAGYPPEIAVKVAQELRATWLIFNRQMKKENKYFLDKLPCGILRITSDNTIEKIRAVPKLKGKANGEESTHMISMEMLPGEPGKKFSPKRPRSLSSEQHMTAGGSSISDSEASISNHASAKCRLLDHLDGQKTPVRTQETEEQDSLFYISRYHEEDQTEVNNKGRSVDEKKQISSHNETTSTVEEFTNPICSVCKNERPKIGTKRDFSYSELHKATKGFSDKNFLSEGGFGSVYKGKLKGITVAVKQHKNASIQGEKEFKSEVNVLSKARHENVVMLLGSCSEGNTRLLVYEYVCNGSLDQHISQHSRTPLSWENMIKIAIGTAKGLLYLHENGIIHRDMRPNNILITHDYQPLLGDFGLARTQSQDSTRTTEVVGAMGYMAPEYAEFGKVSSKTDVYSFGVVLLQLITGMRTTDKRLGGRTLVGWARPLLKERNYPDLIDERVTTCPDFHQLFWMVRIAEKCLSRDPQKRLNMLSVVSVLTGIEEGKTCGIIIRDSYYSSSESGEESEVEDQKSSKSESEDELEIRSLSTEFPYSSGSMSQMSQMTVGFPLSPPLECSSNNSIAYKMFDNYSYDTGEQNEGRQEFLKIEEGY